MRKLKKRGRVGQKASELVNEEGRTFKVDNMVVQIWHMCDGTVTSEDLVKEVSQKIKQKESVVRKTIEILVGKMEKAGVMEYVEWRRGAAREMKLRVSVSRKEVAR